MASLWCVQYTASSATSWLTVCGDTGQDQTLHTKRNQSSLSGQTLFFVNGGDLFAHCANRDSS